MSTQTNTTVRMFGALHTFRQEHGLASTIDVAVPPEGLKAVDLAKDLQLPMDKIEGVFVNHLAFDLSRVVQPGDRVAFIPTGVPGPARLQLGIIKGAQKKGQKPH